MRKIVFLFSFLLSAGCNGMVLINEGGAQGAEKTEEHRKHASFNRNRLVLRNKQILPGNSSEVSDTLSGVSGTGSITKGMVPSR